MNKMHQLRTLRLATSNTLSMKDRFKKNRERGWRRASQANTNQKRAGEPISVFDDIKFKR